MLPLAIDRLFGAQHCCRRTVVWSCSCGRCSCSRALDAVRAWVAPTGTCARRRRHDGSLQQCSDIPSAGRSGPSTQPLLSFPPLSTSPSCSPPGPLPPRSRSSLEVVSLLVALYALVVGPYAHWKQTVLSMLTMVTAILVPITNE